MSRQSVYTPFLRRFTDERALDLADTIALYNRVSTAHATSVWSRSDAIENVSNLIAERVGEIVELPNYVPVGNALDLCQQKTLALETVIFSLPAVDFSRPLSLEHETRIKRHLRSQEYFLAHQEAVSEQLVTAIGNITAGIIQVMPSLGESGLSVPLISSLSNPYEVVDRIIGTLFAPELQQVGLFTALQEQIYENMCRFSGVPLDGSSKKPLIWASEAGLAPQDLVETYLQGTPLSDLLLTPVPFALPAEARFSGQWVIAPPGRGKTTLLHTMFFDDIQRDASIIVMDSKGDLLNPIKHLATIADRLVLIEPDTRHPLALNPLDVPTESIPHTIALIEYILSGLLEAKFTNLQSALFRHVLPAIMQAIPHPTINDLKLVLRDGLTLEKIGKLDDRLRQFFQDKAHGFYAKTYTETRSQIVWRLDFILTNDTMRAMFESPTTRLNIGDAMNNGKIILIDASKAALGDDGSEFYQRFFLALILAAAQQRAKLKPSEKMPVYVYLDECQWVRNDQKLATILDECRSQKIALILAHQRTDQITNPNVLSAMTNCAIRFANSDEEAKFLAPKIRCEPDFLQSMPKGTFAAFVRDLTPRAVALKVPFTDIESLPRMTAEQQAEIRARMQSEYGSVVRQVSARPAADRAVSASTAQPVSTQPPSPETPQSSPDSPEAGSTW